MCLNKQILEKTIAERIDDVLYSQPCIDVCNDMVSKIIQESFSTNLVYRFVASNLLYADTALSASPVVKATRLVAVLFTGTSEYIAILGSVEMGECAIMFDILLVVSVKMPSRLDVTKDSCDIADN